MKLSFLKGDIDSAPAAFVRIRLTEDDKGVRRLVREGKIEWLEIGTGKRSEVNRRTFVTLCRSIIQTAKKHGAQKIAVQLNRSPFPKLNAVPLPELGSLIAQNFEMAAFEFRTFKTKPKDGWKEVTEVLMCGTTPAPMQAGFTRGHIIGQGVNACRELANTPGGDMTPRGLAQAAKRAVLGLPVQVTTMGRKELQKAKMGAILGVGKGSTHEPTFTVMEYKGSPGKPIVLAGKGITFDSGGLNLKSSAGIYEMHMDMSGAAAVMHAVALAARLKLKKHVIGLLPAAENMPGNEAYRPGDILKSLSGKTIEVLNTDAEGRLVLADAITYAKRLKPSVVIDVATLTGASMTALGLYANGVMSRDKKLASKLLEVAEESGDYSWELPLWDEYEDALKGTFADLTNIGNGVTGKYGGAIEGGMFLWQFAKELECPWAHIDMAPRMTSAPGDELAKGAAGSPVRLLVSFIEQWTP